MTGSHRMCGWHPLTSAWILAGMIGIMVFGNPQIVAAQAGSAEVCESGQKFAAADQAVGSTATGSYDEQLAVQDAWHDALAAHAEQLPPGEARSAAETLRGAKTVVSDEEWTEEQSKAYEVMSKHLAKNCDIQLDR